MSTTQERTTTVTVRLPESMRDQLDALAQATGRPRAYLAAEAVRSYLAVEARQVAEIQVAIQRAAVGQFASDDQVATVRQKFQAVARAWPDRLD